MATEKTRQKIIETFLKLLEEHPWDEITLPKIAEEAGVKLSVLRSAFDGKVAIIEHFSRKIDSTVLDEIDDDLTEELPRERLMDILLSRIDALAPHKTAVEAIFKAARQDVSLAAQLNRVSLVSMTWMLNAANIDTSGLEGAMRVQGVSMVFARVLKVWFKDDTSMAKTMAKLDKELRAGERNLKRLNRLSSLLSPLKKLKTLRRARPVDETASEGASAT